MKNKTHVNKPPVTIRRNVADFDDPYIETQSPQEISECKQCGSVYISGRWTLKDQLADKSVLKQELLQTTCPACQKVRDKVPGGVLKMTGDFITTHKDEILNLIRNESNKAQTVNPLERIMTLEATPNGMEITTTNEKLVQRIGRALFKAYSGHIEYKWSEDTKLARVNWSRET